MIVKTSELEEKSENEEDSDFSDHENLRKF